MLLFYIRHGDPIYNPDSLTPLGKRQAEAIAKRLALFGIDRIYASTSTRAIETSQPTCEILKKEATLLDFCNENHAWNEFTVERDGRRTWLFHDRETRRLFCDESIVKLGHNWYEHPQFARHKAGLDRIFGESYEFFASLGYEHERYTGRYKVTRQNAERVALFAHQGFGLAFLSCVLDIPYPSFTTHFDMCHTGMTVIEFRDEGGCAIPRALTLSSDSHLYREGLPLDYNHEFRF